MLFHYNKIKQSSEIKVMVEKKSNKLLGVIIDNKIVCCEYL